MATGIASRGPAIGARSSLLAGTSNEIAMMAFCLHFDAKKIIMPTMTLRDVPDELHAWLKKQAKAHHRSVNKETIALLDRLRGETPAARPRTTVDEMMSIAERVARAPILDDRSIDEIMGYDENGLPR